MGHIGSMYVGFAMVFVAGLIPAFRESARFHPNSLELNGRILQLSRKVATLKEKSNMDMDMYISISIYILYILLSLYLHLYCHSIDLHIDFHVTVLDIRNAPSKKNIGD